MGGILRNRRSPTRRDAKALEDEKFIKFVDAPPQEEEQNNVKEEQAKVEKALDDIFKQYWKENGKQADVLNQIDSKSQVSMTSKKSSKSKRSKKTSAFANSRISETPGGETPQGKPTDESQNSEAQERQRRRSQRSGQRNSRMSIKKDEFVTPDGDVDELQGTKAVTENQTKGRGNC